MRMSQQSRRAHVNINEFNSMLKSLEERAFETFISFFL